MESPLLRELAEMIRKSAEGVKRLSHIDDAHLLMDTTPKTPVFQEDKVILYRYTPVVENPFPIPLLIVYSLVNRPTLVDLHESRSLVRSLISQGIDVYLIDWGYPTPRGSLADAGRLPQRLRGYLRGRDPRASQPGPDQPVRDLPGRGFRAVLCGTAPG